MCRSFAITSIPRGRQRWVGCRLGDSARFTPATITMDSHLSNFTALRGLKKKVTARLFAQSNRTWRKRRFRGSASGRGGGFSQIPPLYSYEGFRFSSFCGFTGILKSNSSNRRSPRATFWSKTSISTERRRCGGIRSYFRPLQLLGVPLFRIYLFEELLKVISKSPIPMSRILLGNVDFDGAPSAGGIQPDPLYNYDGFPISQFYGFT